MLTGRPLVDGRRLIASAAARAAEVAAHRMPRPPWRGGALPPWVETKTGEPFLQHLSPGPASAWRIMVRLRAVHQPVPRRQRVEQHPPTDASVRNPLLLQ